MLTQSSVFNCVSTLGGGNDQCGSVQGALGHPCSLQSDAVMLLLQSEVLVWRAAAFVRLLNSGIPCTGLAASVFVLPALGPTAVVLMMPPAFFYCLFILAALAPVVHAILVP